MDRFTQEQRFDHARDLRKHDTDPLPLRLITPTSRALDIAVLVQGMKNPTKAADLIEQYAQTVAAEARLQAVADTADRVFATLDNFEVPNV